MVDGKYQTLRARNYLLTVGQDVKLRLVLENSIATLTVDDQEELKYQFDDVEILTSFGYATQKSPAYFRGNPSS